MKLILFLFFLLPCLNATAQQDSVATGPGDSLTSVRVPASIKGGQATWRSFLEKNVHADVPARNGAPPGTYVVTVSFLVDTTGKISEVQVLNDPVMAQAKPY